MCGTFFVLEQSAVASVVTVNSISVFVCVCAAGKYLQIVKNIFLTSMPLAPAPTVLCVLLRCGARGESPYAFITHQAIIDDERD